MVRGRLIFPPVCQTFVWQCLWQLLPQTSFSSNTWIYVANIFTLLNIPPVTKRLEACSIDFSSFHATLMCGKATFTENRPQERHCQRDNRKMSPEYFWNLLLFGEWWRGSFNQMPVLTKFGQPTHDCPLACHARMENFKPKFWISGKCYMGYQYLFRSPWQYMEGIFLSNLKSTVTTINHFLPCHSDLCVSDMNW